MNYGLAAEVATYAQWNSDVTILVMIKDRAERSATADWLKTLCSRPVILPFGEFPFAVKAANKSSLVLENGSRIFLVPVSNSPAKGMAISRAYIPRGTDRVLQECVEWMYPCMVFGTIIRY